MTQEESALVGCLIIDANGCEVCTELGIVPESFTDNRLGTIYSTICALYETLPYVDITIITAALTEQKSLAKIGGYEFLEKVADSSGSVTHTRHYAEMVANKWNKRRMLSEMDDLRERMADLPFEAGRAEAESVVMSLQTKGGQEGGWEDATAQAVEKIDAIRLGKVEPGLMTGIHGIDSILHGLKKKTMMVLAARPSMGKTSLAMNVAEKIANEGRNVFIASAETPEESLARRMICARTGVAQEDIDRGYVTEAQMKTIREEAMDVSAMGLHVYDASGKDVADVRSRARQTNRKHNLDLIIVDYLQLLKCRKEAKNGTVAEIGGVSVSCTQMAKELDVPVILLSQLSREPDKRTDHRPKLSDLRGSGDIEQDADIVAFIYRPCKYDDDPENHEADLAVVTVAKHRDGGLGEARLKFIAKRTKFIDREKEENFLD